MRYSVEDLGDGFGVFDAVEQRFIGTVRHPEIPYQVSQHCAAKFTADSLNRSDYAVPEVFDKNVMYA